MDVMFFKILRMDGDYAILQRIDVPGDTEIPLARALLPWDADEGCTLRYADFEYSVV